MADVLLFPFGRSSGVVRSFAAAQAAEDDQPAITEAWRSHAQALADRVMGTVPNPVLNEELYRLLAASNQLANRQRAVRQRRAAAVAERKAVRRLELVRPAQGDLFAEPAPSRIAGRLVEDDASVGA